MQVNNNFQTCRNISDAVPLYLPQKLYLKPIARMNITIHLPINKSTDKSISNWEIMEKLRDLAIPEEFSILKVTKSSLEFIRFEAEIEDKNKLDRVISKLNDKTMKLNGFLDLVKIKASESKSDFPTRHTWDSYFRDAKEMNEMKPGERPDTIHFSNLPIKWFVPHQLSDMEGVKPSEKLFYRIFEKFGSIRYVDIPICDPYRTKMKLHMSGLQTFTFDQLEVFEGYVQFKDYIGFTKTMDAFRGMKLLHKEKEEMLTVNIGIDFDKTKHLSDASVRRRQIVRDRLMTQAREKEQREKKEKDEEEKKKENDRLREVQLKKEKELRRRKREERRKTKQMAKLKVKEADELNDKIAKEEKKLLKVQVKLEAIRLLEELFTRIKSKKEVDLKASKKKHDRRKIDDNELTKLKESSEQDVKLQKEKLHKAIEGRIVLKALLASSSTVRHSEKDSSSDSDSSKKKIKKKRKSNNSGYSSSKSDSDELKLSPDPRDMYGMEPESPWYGPYGNQHDIYQYGPMYPAHMPHRPPMMYPPRGGNNHRYHRGGGGGGGGGPSSSRGGPYPRRRGGYNPRWSRNFRHRNSLYNNPELHHEYVKYFEKFLEGGNDDGGGARKNRSRSRSRSRSRRRSRSKSRSRSRSRKRSYGGGGGGGRRSRSRSYSRSRSKSPRRSRSRSRRNNSRRRSRSRSAANKSCRSRRSNRSRSRSNKPSETRTKRPSNEDDSNKKKCRSRSPSAAKSVDSSSFISPSRLRNRSKSWSMPRDGDKKEHSWSKTPSLKSD